MSTRLIGSTSFAIIAILVITAGFIDQDADPEKPTFAAMAPASVSDTLHVGYNTDITSEGGLQKVALPSAWTKPDPMIVELPEGARLPERPSSFNTLPLMVKTDESTLELQEFSRLIDTEGFQRAKWQDFNYDMEVTYRHHSIDPFIVMIDPGHGGVDPGSVGYNGLEEKDLTLDIAQRVRLFMTEFDDINVQLTRNYDNGLSRQSRVSAIQRSKADMVISLHFNHLPQSDVNVVESYFAGPANIVESIMDRRAKDSLPLHHTSNTSLADINLDFTTRSARLARSLHQRMYREVSFSDDDVYDAGVKEETLFVLTRSFIPAVLLEISCLSDDEEADRLASHEYRNRLAAALVDGIRDYRDSLKSDPLVRQGGLGA